MEKSIDLIFHLKLFEKFYNKYNYKFTIIGNYLHRRAFKSFFKIGFSTDKLGIYLAFLPLFCALRITPILNKRNINPQNRYCFFFINNNNWSFENWFQSFIVN